MSDEKNNNKQYPNSVTNTSRSPHISMWKVLIPVVIGLTVVVWLFRREFSVKVWDSIHFDAHVIVCILLAWLCMAGRDFGLTWRFRSLTDRELTWWQAIKVNFMCEFTSAVTPSAVGGSSLGMIFLHHEGIALGRATTLMMTTLFLDELFFVVSCPIIVAIVPYDELFGFSHTKFEIGLRWVFLDCICSALCVDADTVSWHHPEAGGCQKGIDMALRMEVVASVATGCHIIGRQYGGYC